MPVERHGRALRLVIRAEPAAVREGLEALCDSLLRQGFTEDARGSAELVLAEVLNNVVEHALNPTGGDIEVTLVEQPGGLSCRIVDAGRPMPGGRLPAGTLPVADEGELPEGGFGWHLIRTLSQDLRYSRRNGRNHLSFRLDRKGTGKQSD